MGDPESRTLEPPKTVPQGPPETPPMSAGPRYSQGPSPPTPLGLDTALGTDNSKQLLKIAAHFKVCQVGTDQMCLQTCLQSTFSVRFNRDLWRDADCQVAVSARVQLNAGG
jgi:hypothetical protein